MKLPIALPLMLAPMAGGPTSPELLAAVTAAGAGGFLPGGYLTAAQLEGRLGELSDRMVAAGLGDSPHGVNLFVPGPTDRRRDENAVALYSQRLGEGVGRPDWGDRDHYEDKLRLLLEVHPVAMVSFTFGCPTAEEVTALHRAGSRVLVTVTDAEEARAAAAVGADALVAQGFDAGGHRGTHAVTKIPNRRDALALIPELTGLGLPLIAAGGVATRGDVQRLLAAGAVAVQVGTAFLRCPEAGTSAAHRDLLVTARGTKVTRAFSGRPARGLVNDFLLAHDDQAPAVYPQVDQITKPLRAAAAARGDSSQVSGWAGTGWAAAQEVPAAEVIASLLP
ncbi:nitroalkane oxidase [Luteococcus japonicus]|uniref:Propionate 3-nitronate monooxygenase n=1 Tax=Luteococcus japonicus TaxID=33984 RepID=A0A3N1ZW89_9ACTN|nr:nitronate monooxygenase [Luteococcus japonicus]ROR54988.1 nitroalkane oxidase [Luteococcus japonicus]